jgi:hypothetical protein
VRNPVKSPPGGLLTVTQDNYLQYLRHRRQGLGNQGVGPMQLTSAFLQDRADQLGGCWQPGPNIRVGLEFLACNIRRLGLRAGGGAYNGSGPAAQRYGDDVLAARGAGTQRCARPPAEPEPKPKPERPPRAGHAGRNRGPSAWSPRRCAAATIAAFQQLLNERFAAWGIDKRIDVDGSTGRSPAGRRARPSTRWGSREPSWATA